MPDFDTRTPQEERQDKPLRVRMLLIVNKPRALLMATKRRIPVIANRLRSLLLASKGRGLLVADRLRGLMVANGFRTMLIGGGILLFVVAAVPAGMLIYSSSGMGDQQQEAQQQEEPVSGMQIGSLENINVDPDLKRKVVLQLSTPDSSSDSDVSRYGIWTIDANGTGLKQLTDTAEESSHSYEDPARSPDLEKIAFTRVRLEGRVSESLVEGKSAIPYTLEVPYIFVMNADGSDQSQLVDGVGAKPDWSPDGKQIAFSSYEMWSSLGMSEDGECDLYVASADGSDTPRRLTTEPGCESNPSWSPDGTKIAFTHNWRGNLDIYVVSGCCEESETLQPRQLTDDPLDDTEPVWSPDGTKIAFTHSPDDSDSGNVDADIYKMDADGSGKIRLTHSGAMEKQPTWSPDGTKIIFIRQGLPGVNPESTGLFMMDSDGTNPIAVKVFEITTAFFPEWGGAAQQDKVAEGAIEGEHTEQAIADWRALDAPLPEKAVEAYIDQIKRQQEILRSSEEGNDERWMAYVRTGNLLRTLGPASKGKVVRFLAEAGLVQSSRTGWTNSSASVAASASSAGLPSDRSQPIIELIGADLSGANLSGVNLSGADLNQADLRGANLSRADLSRADLTFADLSGADLRGANLSRAYLGGAYLRHTNLSGAELTATDLSGADLSGARGFDEQLELQVGTLDNTIMPDGSRHRRCPSYAPQPC